MRDGALVHQGTPAEIMTGGVLRDVYDVDIRIEEVQGHRTGVYFT